MLRHPLPCHAHHPNAFALVLRQAPAAELWVKAVSSSEVCEVRSTAGNHVAPEQPPAPGRASPAEALEGPLDVSSPAGSPASLCRRRGQLWQS